MDFTWKKIKLHTLSLSWQLDSLHSSYKNCVADHVQKYMVTGVSQDTEFCTEEKKNFYNALHETKKIEHDSLIRFYTTRVNC